jgi:hypothetical protein
MVSHLHALRTLRCRLRGLRKREEEAQNQRARGERGRLPLLASTQNTEGG